MPSASYDPATFDPSRLNGSSSGLTLDQVNRAFRLSPVYQQWMTAHGKPLNGLVKLTDSERNGLGKTLENNGFTLPDGWEIDQGGNIHEESHLGRNVLIGAGIAAAAFGIPAIVGALGPGAAAGLGGVEAGATSGLSPFVASGALGSGVVGGSGLATAATTAGVGKAAYDAAGKVITKGASTSNVLENILKYGVPVAGSLIGAGIQSSASNAASDAQQKYLQEALNYQKEQDALDRKRQTMLDEQNIERYNRNVSTEAGRYGDFTGNIAPFVASGQAANAKAASLLGLSPSNVSVAGGTQRYSGAGPSNAHYVDPIQDADKLAPADRAKVDALLAKYNSSDNPLYWYGVNAQHGGFDKTGADWNEHRISIGDGAGKGYKPTQTTTAPPANSLSVAGPEAPQAKPTAAEPMVTIQAPNGATKDVPQSQAEYWKGKGATILQEVAA